MSQEIWVNDIKYASVEVFHKIIDDRIADLEGVRGCWTKSLRIIDKLKEEIDQLKHENISLKEQIKGLTRVDKKNCDTLKKQDAMLKSIKESMVPFDKLYK